MILCLMILQVLLYISHHLLVAMPGLLDPIFSKSVVYLAEHSGEGAMGIVINKPCELDLRALLTKLNLEVKTVKKVRGFRACILWGPYTTGPRVCFA